MSYYAPLLSLLAVVSSMETELTPLVKSASDLVNISKLIKGYLNIFATYTAGGSEVAWMPLVLVGVTGSAMPFGMLSESG